MRKKLFFLLVLPALAVALAGCSLGNQTEEQKANDQAEPAKVQALEGQTPNDQTPTDQTTNNQAAQATNPNSQTMTDSNLPTMIIDKSKTYTAILHTDAGDIEIALNAKGTPITANNFVWLAKKNFYDNTIFHRVIKGFMIQGGDPKGDGTGGPGYKFNDEPFTGEYKRGTIAMANSGPNTNGSQFFIMHADYGLPKNYVIFGQVIKGLEVVDKIATAPVTYGPSGENSTPATPVIVKSVEILEK